MGDGRGYFLPRTVFLDGDLPALLADGRLPPLVAFCAFLVLLADFADYIATQNKVDALYLNPSEWQRKAILNVAGMGNFSSARTIRDYAVDTWKMGSLLKKV